MGQELMIVCKSHRILTRTMTAELIYQVSEAKCDISGCKGVARFVDWFQVDRSDSSQVPDRDPTKQT